MKESACRIIAGQWRSRKVVFPLLPGLRPTGGRTRETLFNWLRDDIVGSRCLDAFAGSGVLGFEALSRGAEDVVFLDANRQVLTCLQQTAQALGAEAQADIRFAKLPRFPDMLPFDIVFLDPPFNQNLLAPAVEALQAQGLLKAGALVYCEKQKTRPFTAPNDWVCLRENVAGQVGYALYQLA